MVRVANKQRQADMILIHQIALRASLKWNVNLMDTVMDLTATHLNGCPLDLKKLLKADDFNLAHDIFGIRDHINRKTGTLERCFLPRCSI